MDFQNVQINGKGKVLLKVTDLNDQDSRWGWYLTDGESVWDGGFGIADNKKIIPTKKDSKKLREAKKAIKDGSAIINFNRYSFEIFDPFNA